MRKEGNGMKRFGRIATPDRGPECGAIPANLHPSSPMAVVLIASLSIMVGCGKQPTNTLSALQGEWVVRSTTGNGPGHVFRGLVGKTVTVKGNTLGFTDFAGWELRTIKVGPSSSVCTIDIDGEPKRWKRKGVFKVVGNQWTLSVNFPQYARPTGFEDRNDGREVVVLERAP